jgi:hypothetical protein
MGLSDQSSASTPLAIHSPRSAYFLGEEVISTLTDLSPMNAAWGLGRDSTGDRTTAKEWLQRFPQKIADGTG